MNVGTVPDAKRSPATRFDIHLFGNILFPSPSVYGVTMTDLASSLDLIARLVQQFHTNRAAYHAPEYKEAHARQELIAPLFIALGWDVHNEKRAAPQYREVILEDSLEVEGEDARKAPDYAFRVGETRKFFAEAKKPGVALKTAARPAYQLRRYAWSAKLPLSLLTDFEELGIYDCRSRPSEKDKATAGRINYYWTLAFSGSVA